ncbi:hypothetical protein P280DRAFT_480070 [Massarina eburnea CBS 473.64]|uniref:Uncharacterized protein n=1 Tax=Massarina eburnea CBS 473.64 TaxID=1395130 RepID=A0A6A6RYY3_9PLEO|nr:hypothetical protein P280DRAFT_480070 [Massarina eburnea CBS 473.64]
MSAGSLAQAGWQPWVGSGSVRRVRTNSLRRTPTSLAVSRLGASRDTTGWTPTLPQTAVEMLLHSLSAGAGLLSAVCWLLAARRRGRRPSCCARCCARCCALISLHQRRARTVQFHSPRP